MEKFYPKEENLGRECEFWNKHKGCGFPKAQLEGRFECEGIIDDVCLFKSGKIQLPSLTGKQITQFKINPFRDREKF